MTALGQLLGESPPIVAIREQVGRLLRSASAPGRRLPPILILGETGTGKGLLASTIHRASGRAGAPFVDVNCAAIPETLIEAELFGFERGAFTDARQAKPGLFQTAHGGAIFLDEVGLLPLSLQAKLLKVLEERSVRRLGSTRSEPLDVSVVAATSEDLPGAVKAGRFRPDLYHRLAVVTLELPPLRARGRDVVLLAEHVLAHVCQDYGLPATALTEDARDALLAYDWPGNVRELGNVLERAALLAEEPRLTAARLGLPARSTAVAAPETRSVSGAGGDDEGERRHLTEALGATDWNLTRAASRLGIPRNTLRYRMERLGLTPEGPPARRRGGRPPARPRAMTAGDSAGLADRRDAQEAASAPESREPRRGARRVTLMQVRLTAPAHGPEAPEIRRALDATADKLESFGRHVEERSASGLLAAFGLTPEEDAPRRAAHAALAVQRLASRARMDIARRPDAAIALHTGSLLLSQLDAAIDIDADALSRARRTLWSLLDAAGPGAVVASADTARFLAPRFDLAPLPEGDSSTAGARRVVRHAEAGRTRFVGRERELALLAERFELAQAGRGQVVLIVGEPGIGKSRLLHEFRRRLGASATWVEGQALSFGRSTPFHPVIDMLRRVFRIDDGDPEAVVVEKIERGVRRLGDDARETLPFVRYLLSVDPGDPAVRTMDPKLRHAAIVRASHLLLERGAVLRPHVVVLEDTHWCDPATEDWIVRLADSIAAKRALLLLSCRPGYRPPSGDRSFHTGLALSTLSDPDTVRIAQGLLASDDLPPELQALIVDKAEGNPFFVEELMRSLLETGAVRRDGERVVMSGALDRLAVPDTIEATLLARVQRLDDSLRELLEVASVIGRTVPFPLVRAVVGLDEEALGGGLRRLQAAEFVYETRVFPELEHTFKHALTQDVAYGSLAPDRRRSLHARIVEAIERLYPNRPGEHLERLAYHATRGELWERALRYSRQAGDKAFDRSANREAVASWEQALAALVHLPERRENVEAAIDIRLALRSGLLQLGEIPRIIGYLREAGALASGLGDRRRLAWALTYMTIAHLFAGDPGQALSVGEQAYALAEEVGDVGLRATARTPWGHAHRERGDHRRAVALFREAIDALTGDLLRERLGQAMPPSLYARNIAAVSLAELGEFGEATRLGTESADLARTLDLPFGFALARIALGHTALLQGRLAEAADDLGMALELIRARGIPTWYPWAAAARGYALALSGRTGEGLPLLEGALERAMALPFLFGHSQWVSWFAHASLIAGRMEEADRLGREGVRLSRERGEQGYEAWGLHILAVIARAEPARGQEAEALDIAGLALADQLGMRPLAARCHLALGESYRGGREHVRADEHLTRARALIEELDMRVEESPAH
jgi:transcriptional regulator with AAA-type ATPase domain/tetratricopeptide (TPR) repeat protein